MLMVRKATLDLEVSVSSIQAIRIFRELAEEAGWASSVMKVHALSTDSPSSCPWLSRHARSVSRC